MASFFPFFFIMLSFSWLSFIVHSQLVGLQSETVSLHSEAFSIHSEAIGLHSENSACTVK